MATIRVYELAKEMGMNSKDLLESMIELGLPMKNHMSTIPGNEVNRIKAMVMKHMGDPNAEPIPRPAEKKEKPPLSGLKNRPIPGRDVVSGANDTLYRSEGQRPAGFGQSQGAGGRSAAVAGTGLNPGQRQGQSQGQSMRTGGGVSQGHGMRPPGQGQGMRPGSSAGQRTPGAGSAQNLGPGMRTVGGGPAQGQGKRPVDGPGQSQGHGVRPVGSTPGQGQGMRSSNTGQRPAGVGSAQSQGQGQGSRPASSSPSQSQGSRPVSSSPSQSQGSRPAGSDQRPQWSGQGTGSGQGQSQGARPVGGAQRPQWVSQGAGSGQGQSQGQGQNQGQASRPAGAGQGQPSNSFPNRPNQNRPGQGGNRFASGTDKYQTGAKPQQKPRKPITPGAADKSKAYNKGPKAPTIGKDTADQVAHLGPVSEEDSRFLNKVEKAVGEKAYERGGIARTPNRRTNRYEDNRNARNRGKGKDRGKLQRQEPAAVVIKNITLDGPVSVMEFAHLLNRKTADVIKKLMQLGVMANINQELDMDTLTLLGQEFGTVVEAKITKEEILIAADEPDSPENLQERPPVVTIMGHVDHGKTSLLDTIRQANVQASEAGGITQHIGAYQVEVSGRKITFLDTPGHEAFTAMRARGAQCTDIAILVVAADDGVMPQTIEAINHAKGAGVPIVVAINKIDKEGANPERVKQELTEHGLVSEEWGGDTIFAEVSAKTKQGIDQLLEMILLVADIGDLKANPNRKAKGVVIEAKLDKGRGPVATILVQNGTLETGDFVIVGTAQGRIRAMNDERGRQVKKARPSMPVEIIGLSEVPEAGDAFQVVGDERLAKQIANERTAVKREEVIHSRSRISLDDLFAQIQTGEVKDLNIIIKADVHGSIEALKQSLEKLSNEEVRVQIIHQAVGGIKEADVDFASASNAIILGFNVRPDVNAKKAAEANQVDIRLYRVIYNAIEDVKSALSGLLKPEIRENVIGRAEVRQVIRVPKVGAVAGSYILEGKISRGCLCRVIRDHIVIFEGNLGSLRRFKDDVKEVATGFECGISIDRFNDFQEGDNIEAFVMEEIKRELA